MMHTLRETGTGENERPTPTGDFDGVTRAAALKLLLNPEVKTSWTDRARSFIERFGAVLGAATLAGIIWTGPKLTPQEAADVLRPNQTRVVVAEDGGPTFAVVGEQPDPFTAYRGLGYLMEWPYFRREGRPTIPYGWRPRVVDARPQTLPVRREGGDGRARQRAR